MKENVIENKKEELAEYMQQAAALVQQYVPVAGQDADGNSVRECFRKSREKARKQHRVAGEYNKFVVSPGAVLKSLL